MQDKVLELSNVNAYYKDGKVRKQILNDISFTLYEGEIVGLVGESGSGKTTLCKCILGLLKDYEGNIMHYTNRPQMVFQDPFSSLNPRKTIGWILEEPLKIQGKRSKEERRKKAEEMLELVHLPKEFYSRYPRELSGGQRQRVAMGRAIVRNPKVFLMDEPLSNLDAKLRVQMRIEISKLHENLGATIIYVTHDQTEAMTLGTRIVVMKDGVVQQVDTPQALYNTPCNLFVAGFIGSPQMNFMDAKCAVNGEDVTLTVGKHVLKVPASKKKALIEGGYDGKTVVLGIRPEDVHDSQAFINNSADSVIESTIKVYELLGAEVFLYFDIEGTQMTARVNPRTTLRTGDKAVFALDMEKIHVFDKETELTITN